MTYFKDKKLDEVTVADLALLAEAALGDYVKQIADAQDRIADATEQLTKATIIHNEQTRTTNQRLGWIEEALTGKIKQPKPVEKEATDGKKQQSKTGS